MPRYYVDLDNNRLISGAQDTRLASTPKLYRGDKPTVELELVTRTDGVLGYYTSAASAVNLRVGTLGGTALASALTLSAVTLSVQATATAGITAPVTATAVAAMLGSVTATAAATVNSPATATLSATFSQIQLPTVIPVMKANKVIGLEIPTCGLNFSSTPSVYVSEPDIFRKKSFNLGGTGLETVTQTIHVPEGTENWPSVMRLLATGFAGRVVANYTISAQSGTVVTFLANAVTLSAPVPTNGTATAQTVVTNLGFYGGAVTATMVVGFTDDYGGGATLTGSVDVRQPENRAVILPTVSAGRLSLRVTHPGDSYADVPDVFIVPQPADYTLGDAKTVTSARISGRTTVVTSTAHGLAAGSLIQVEGLDFIDPFTSYKYFGVKGVWPLVSVTTDSMTFRIDQFASDPSVFLSLTTVGAKIYPVTLCRTLTGLSVTCAGSGFAENSAIEVSLDSDSCGGFAAAGVVSISSAGLASAARVTCAGSGFTTASTVVTLAPYRRLASVSVTCAGAGYWSALPAVTVDSTAYVATAPGARPAVVTASLNGNGTLSLSITCAGYGYTTAPAITIAPPNAGDGLRSVTVGTAGVGYADGSYACTVSAAPAGGADAVVNFVKAGTSQSFAIVNPGRGYPSAPVITVPAPNLGGQVGALTITNDGGGYTTIPQVTFSGGGGSGAAASAVLENGTVTSITITTGGTGYTSAPAVALQAPGTVYYYAKALDMSGAGVTTLLGSSSNASAYLQIEEKYGADTTVLAQLPVTIQQRVS